MAKKIKQEDNMIQSFINAQSQFHVVKDKKNPFHKSTYASLSSIYKSCKPALHENGFGIFHFVLETEQGQIVKTVLHHVSGEKIEVDIPMLLEGANMQKLGSAITYAKRYGLVALLAVDADDDDDGNAASGLTQSKSKPRRQQNKTRSQKPDPALQQRAIELEEIEKEWNEDRKRFCASVKDFGGYDEVSEWSMKIGLGSPKEWKSEKRLKFLNWLRNEVISVGQSKKVVCEAVKKWEQDKKNNASVD